MTIALRPATLEDCKFVWETNNHPTVRAVSLSSDEIVWEDHVRWYAQLLEDENRHLLIGQHEAANAGVIRFDLDDDLEGNRCVVSVALAASFRGQGFGRQLISEGTKHALVRWCDVVTAWVMPDNTASRRAFEQAGYQLVGDELRNNVQMLRLEAR